LLEFHYPTISGRSIHIYSLGKKELHNLEDFSISEKVSKVLGIDKNKIFSLKQEHGLLIHEAPWDSGEEISGDAIFTVKPEIALVIKTADCMPIFFWDEKTPIVCAVHSGWQGTVGNILENTVNRVVLDKKSIRFFLSQSIRQSNYEVQEDVVCNFRDKYPDSFYPTLKGFQLGLERALSKQIQLISPEAKFFDSGICTFEHPDFYSHRRGDRGRNLNIIYFQ
jgi:YfiH family protein